MEPSRVVSISALIAVSLVALAGCGGGDGAAVIATPQPVIRSASLDNNQVATTSTAAGGATFAVDPGTKRISGIVVTSPIDNLTAAHIHAGAFGVQNPTPLIGLVNAGGGVWYVPDNAALATLSDADFTAYQNGGLYVNIHTTQNPDGEIRGQIEFTTTVVKPGAVTGAQEAPTPVATAATGTGAFVFNPTDNKIRGGVIATGMTGNNAHLHVGAPGVAGPVHVPLLGGPTIYTTDNVLVGADNVANLLAGNFYVNVHSADFFAGEIRGQLNRQIRFAALDGAQEVPPVVTAATGRAIIVLDPATGGISGEVRTSGLLDNNTTAAHIHGPAVRGAEALSIITLTKGAGGLWTVPAGAFLTTQQEADYNAGLLYVNVHTAQNPDGEIRGQIDRTQTFSPF